MSYSFTYYEGFAKLVFFVEYIMSSLHNALPGSSHLLNCYNICFVLFQFVLQHPKRPGSVEGW